MSSNKSDRAQHIDSRHVDSSLKSVHEFVTIIWPNLTLCAITLSSVDLWRSVLNILVIIGEHFVNNLVRVSWHPILQGRAGESVTESSPESLKVVSWLNVK